MREKESELLLKIQETEQVLLELKKELEKEKERTRYLLPLLSLKNEESVSLHSVESLFRNDSIYVDFSIRSGGEFAFKGIYLGHYKPKWEIVKDSLDAFVLVPKELL
jgi:hypothetical protein